VSASATRLPPLRQLLPGFVALCSHPPLHLPPPPQPLAPLPQPLAPLLQPPVLLLQLPLKWRSARALPPLLPPRQPSPCQACPPWRCPPPCRGGPLQLALRLDAAGARWINFVTAISPDVDCRLAIALNAVAAFETRLLNCVAKTRRARQGLAAPGRGPWRRRRSPGKTNNQRATSQQGGG